MITPTSKYIVATVCFVAQPEAFSKYFPMGNCWVGDSQTSKLGCSVLMKIGLDELTRRINLNI